MAYDDRNIFAKILRGEAPAHIVFEDANSVAFMDLMPQVDGHTLVIPRAPAENLFDIEPSALALLMRTTQHRCARCAGRLRRAGRDDRATQRQRRGPVGISPALPYPAQEPRHRIQAARARRRANPSFSPSTRGGFAPRSIASVRRRRPEAVASIEVGALDTGNLAYFTERQISARSVYVLKWKLTQYSRQLFHRGARR